MTTATKTQLDSQLVASPCSNPKLGLDEALGAYSKLGYRKFEVFTSWTKSAFDIDGDPAFYLEKGAQYEMQFPSLHLPPIGDDIDAGVAKAVKATEFARAIGVGVVLYKASSRENYIKGAKAYLDATEHLGVTPVLQNHYGTPISTLDDFREVIEGINDSRMKTLFEVGHFHKAGIDWRDGYELLKGSIALVHIKDMVGQDPVPFGEGEVGLPELFVHMHSVGYTGDYVIEMEVCMSDIDRTLKLLGEARSYLLDNCQE